MTWGAALVASLFATLGRPRWWALALAGFLVRGGLVVILIPLVDLPSTAGLANALGPIVIGFAFGNTPPAVLLLVGWAAFAAIAWLAVATTLGAWFELTLTREAAADEELESRAIASGAAEVDAGRTVNRAHRPWDLGRAVAARLLAHVPTAIVLAVGAIRIGEATYAELIAPGEDSLPVAIRVVLRVPETILIVAGTWFVGEAVGGYAVRRVAARDRLGAALRSAVRGVLGRGSGLATVIATAIPTFAAIGVVVLVLGQAWIELRLAILDDRSPLDVLVAIWVLTAAWVAGLWLLSLATAWRSAAWSFEAFRRDP